MRYVEGSDLKTLLREGPLDPGRAIAICSQVAAALDAAHARGLVHRDVKPSNVLLDTQEHVYLADFGLSRRLAEQTPELEATLSLGTPAYVAPEQIEGAEVDAQADVYSLGCLLHECLTGGAPYPRESELAVLWAHLNDPPPAPAGLEEVMAKALAKRPEERYASCTELVNAAREALGLGTRRDRRPLVLAGAGLLVAAAALTTGLVLAFGNDGAATAKADLTVRNNSLVRIDPEDSKIGAVTPVGRGPEAVAIGGNTVWTYNWDDRTVSAVDEAYEPRRADREHLRLPSIHHRQLDRRRRRRRLGHQQPRRQRAPYPFAAGRLPAAGVQLPWDPISVAVGEGAVWVAAKDIRGSAVLKIDPTTGSVLEATPLRGAVVDNQSQFRDVQWLAVGNGAVWAVQGGTLFRIDPRTARVTARLNLPVHEPGESPRVKAPSGSWSSTRSGETASSASTLGPCASRRASSRQASRAEATPRATRETRSRSLKTPSGGAAATQASSGRSIRGRRRSGRQLRVTAPVESFGVKAPYGITAGNGGVWVAVRVAP